MRLVVTGIILILFSLLLACVYGDDIKYAIASFILIIAGGVFCIVACRKYFNKRNEEDLDMRE